MSAIRQSFVAGKRAPLAVLPTGGGKTACFSFITMSAEKLGKKIFILVHRKELLVQASGSLDRLGVPHGVIHPAFNMSMNQSQIASVQTLAKRVHKFEPPNLIIIDEAHHATAMTYRNILKAFPKAHVLGVTATPCRTDGKGLGLDDGGIFDDLIEGPSIGWLISEGYLTKPKLFAPPVGLDFQGVKKRMGDYDPKDLAKRFNKPTITGDVIEHYYAHCKGMPAVTFCYSIEHTKQIADAFNSAGVRAAHVDGGMKDDDRKNALDGLASGNLDMVTSKDLIGEGVDIPICSAALLLRPTYSKALYLQQCGRVLRPVYAPGYDLSTRQGRLAAIANGPKPYAVILDFVGNVLHHGFPDDDQEWTLKGEMRGKKSKSENGILVRIEQCEKCYFTYEVHEAKAITAGCPNCGHVQKTKARKILEREGELEELTRAQVEAARAAKFEEYGANSIEELMIIGQKRGYANPYKWAEKKYYGRLAKKNRGAK